MSLAHAQAELKVTGVANVIVVLDQPPADATAAGTRAARSRASVSAKRIGRFFVSAETSVNSQIAAATAAVRKSGRAKHASGYLAQSARSGPMRYFPNLGVMYGTVSRDGLAALKRHRGVAAVTSAPVFSLIRPVSARAATLSRRHTWGLERLRIPELWAEGLSGKGVLVGHLDTGVDGRHPALRTAIAKFADFDALGRAKSPVPAPYDTDSHGTQPRPRSRAVR